MLSPGRYLASPTPTALRLRGRLPCPRGSIPLPFDEALKAAMKVPADKLAKPNGKKPKKAKKAKKAKK